MRPAEGSWPSEQTMASAGMLPLYLLFRPVWRGEGAPEKTPMPPKRKLGVATISALATHLSSVIWPELTSTCGWDRRCILVSGRARFEGWDVHAAFFLCLACSRLKPLRTRGLSLLPMPPRYIGHRPQKRPTQRPAFRRPPSHLPKPAASAGLRKVSPLDPSPSV